MNNLPWSKKSLDILEDVYPQGGVAGVQKALREANEISRSYYAITNKASCLRVYLQNSRLSREDLDILLAWYPYEGSFARFRLTRKVGYKSASAIARYYGAKFLLGRSEQMRRVLSGYYKLYPEGIFHDQRCDVIYLTKTKTANAKRDNPRQTRMDRQQQSNH